MLYGRGGFAPFSLRAEGGHYGPRDPRHLPRPAPRRLRLRRGRRDRRLSRRAGHQPPLQLALSAGRRGQHAWLRRRRPPPRQRGARRREAHARFCEALGSRARPGARHRAQPHGDHGRREPVVVGRAGERPGQPLRRLLRRRLGPARGRCATRCSCRSWATTTAACSKPASCGSTVETRSFAIRYHEHVFPVAPALARYLLAAPPSAAGPTSSPSSPMPWPTSRCPRRPTGERAPPASRQGGPARTARPSLAERPEVADGRRRRGRGAQRRSRALDELLERQNYRLAFWRTAARDLDYRRFFDVNTLVGLRIEDERVFADTHALVLDGSARACSTGCGSTTPTACAIRRTTSSGCRAAPEAWIVVEKILEPGERLRDLAGGRHHRLRLPESRRRPVRRSRGRAAADRALRRVHRRVRRLRRAGAEKKHQVLRELLASDVNRLAALFLEVCERHRRHRDYTRHELHEALREVIACFPVYRTYVQAEAGQVERRRRPTMSPRRSSGRRAAARSSTPSCSISCATCCSLRVRGELEDRAGDALPAAHRAGHGQGRRGHGLLQLQPAGRAQRGRRRPGPLRRLARGVPPGLPEAQERWPQAMLATSTHDTKRSEDVRARIDLLSEIPARWGEAVRRWAALNERHRRGGWPDRNTEYLLYQTLVGAWPSRRARASPTWRRPPARPRPTPPGRSPNADYEEALRGFVEACWPTASSRPTSQPSWRRWSTPGGSTRSPRPCSSSPPPASPTSTRAPSCGISAWSIPTTAGRSTTSCAGGC